MMADFAHLQGTMNRIRGRDDLSDKVDVDVDVNVKRHWKEKGTSDKGKGNKTKKDKKSKGPEGEKHGKKGRAGVASKDAPRGASASAPYIPYLSLFWCTPTACPLPREWRGF